MRTRMERGTSPLAVCVTLTADRTPQRVDEVTLGATPGNFKHRNRRPTMTLTRPGARAVRAKRPGHRAASCRAGRRNRSGLASRRRHQSATSRGSALQSEGARPARRGARRSTRACRRPRGSPGPGGSALDQAEALLDRVDLRDPGPGVVPQQREERVVLRQRVRELDQRAEQERPQRAAPSRLGLVRVGVEHRAVVRERQLGEPLDHAMGRGGAEAHGTELLRRLGEPRQLALELLP